MEALTTFQATPPPAPAAYADTGSVAGGDSTSSDSTFKNVLAESMPAGERSSGSNDTAAQGQSQTSDTSAQNGSSQPDTTTTSSIDTTGTDSGQGGVADELTGNSAQTEGGQSASIALFTQSLQQTVSTGTLVTSVSADQAGSQQATVSTASQNISAATLEAVVTAAKTLTQEQSSSGQATSQQQSTGGQASSESTVSTVQMLQALVQNNNPKDSVTIQQTGTRNTLSGLAQFTQASVATVTSASVTAEQTPTEPLLASLTRIAIEPEKGVSEKVVDQQPALRQSIRGQYLDAKLDTHDKNNAEQNTQQNSSGSGENKQQQAATVTSTMQTEMSVLTDKSQTGMSFGTQLQTATATTATAATSQTTSYLSTPQVHEDEILSQVLQRFRVNTKLQSSQLSLKLHPAELGQLKIDISIKDDSVRANIFAQSQQVQEVLEKNMPRLRLMLEEQGLSIDSLIVTRESDSVGEFDLFQDTYSTNQDAHHSENESADSSAFTASLEEMIVENNDTSSGVNVKI